MTQEDINRNDIQWIKEGISRIEKQTTKTNGRVNKLEDWKTQTTWYLRGLIGSFALLSGVFFWAFNSYIDQRIDEANEKQLSSIKTMIENTNFELYE